MSAFPHKDVVTPLGDGDVWATSGTHVGLQIARGTVNRVDYRIRLDLSFRDGEWKMGTRGDDWSDVYHSLLASRADWRPHLDDKPSRAAREKMIDVLVPWLNAFLATVDGQILVRSAEQQDAEAKKRSAEKAVRDAEEALAEARRRLAEIRFA